MRKRIEVSLEEELIDELNQHCQVSPLSRSEIVGIALRRLFREERRRAAVDLPATEMARRIAVGELPSRLVDAAIIDRFMPSDN